MYFIHVSASFLSNVASSIILQISVMKERLGWGEHHTSLTLIPTWHLTITIFHIYKPPRNNPIDINVFMMELKIHTRLILRFSFVIMILHGDVIKWKHFPRYWPFVRGIHRSPVNSPHKGQWRGALMFSLICAWINGWVNNREAGDLRRHRDHYDVIAMNHLKPTGNWHSFYLKITRSTRLMIKGRDYVHGI